MHAAVVDPSRVVLKIIAQLLSEHGAVSCFVDSEAALQSIKSDPTIDVLITSLEVEPISGLELCWEARMAMPTDRPLYVIVMSSLRDEEKLAEALDCGADDLIAKPLRGVELHARLRMAGRLKVTQLDLVRLTETNPMTGLFNRRAFFDRMGKLFRSSGDPRAISAIMLDIDHFKQVNDRYGHDVGDTVIKQIASQVNGSPGIVGRLGGEEFAIVLEGHHEIRARALAEALRQSCAELQFSGDGQPFGVTCSFGVSQWVQGDCPDDLLKRADVALYQAKTNGRNCVVSATGDDVKSLPSENIRGHSR